MRKQQRNRRSTPFVTYDGHLIPLIEAAERSGVKYPTVWARYKRGWPEDRLFEKPTHERPQAEWVRSDTPRRPSLMRRRPAQPPTE
jgi:hypothetical protein